MITFIAAKYIGLEIDFDDSEMSDILNLTKECILKKINFKIVLEKDNNKTDITSIVKGMRY
jgi:hypothetical protein